MRKWLPEMGPASLCKRWGHHFVQTYRRPWWGLGLIRLTYLRCWRCELRTRL